MSVIRRVLAMLAAMAMGALGACGGDEAPPLGAPVPPDASATTDCVELGGGAGPATAGGAVRTAGEPLPYGFNDHAGLVGAIPITLDAELHERAGSQLWRVAIDWRFAEPEPERISLETHDAIYCEALARGIRPLFHITGAPAWAAASGECPVTACIDPPRPEALDDLREFSELVARRYPLAAAIEAWNEPNLATFWSHPDPERYVEVLAAISAGVEAADPSLPVLGGSLSNTGRTDETRIDFREFLRAMYRAGAASAMDGLAFHPYPLEPLGSPGERFSRSMAQVRRIAREPLWVTEVGLPVGDDVSEAEQAAALRDVYDRLSRDPRVEVVVFHTLLDGIAAGDGDGFGWFAPGPDGELVPRDVYHAFALRP